ncbi:uncharacterized protein MAM_08418 [Metarhizium album ARSEF 1941]|uniref:Uncharacterized protein n=1 Tax=Metarhizium album (strain ARSEF 1941) TaxID=1081103 RepID=A0A0B2WD25_METAS|nr:uncharacterized protein MAM_08418 [Metarhizium album ARSEF 1941]KHN93726.1 hypothetical protein MAM_08418 [Metarhizium album ARSEF 1941]
MASANSAISSDPKPQGSRFAASASKARTEARTADGRLSLAAELSIDPEDMVNYRGRVRSSKPLNVEALFGGKIDVDKIAVHVGRPRGAPASEAVTKVASISSASSSNDDDPPRRPAPVPSLPLGKFPSRRNTASSLHSEPQVLIRDEHDTFRYYAPIPPPVGHWLPELVKYQNETHSHMMARIAGVDVLYSQLHLMSNTERYEWERRFMGYFRWTPWSRRSGLSLVQWVKDRGYDSTWTPEAKAMFAKVSQSGFPHPRYYPKVITVFDEFTRRMQDMLIGVGIYNLAFAKIRPDYYIVVPIGHSRLVYWDGDFSPLERSFIAVWYPYSFISLTALPGDSDRDTFERELFRLGTVLKRLYVDRVPCWREAFNRLQAM